MDEPADHGDGGELRKLEEHENQDDRPQLLALIEAVTDGEGGVDHELGGRNGKDEIAEKLKDDQQRVTAQRGLHFEERCENIIEKMVEGRIEKYYKEVCLLEQPFVKNPDESVSQMINGRFEVIGFTRYEMGEGLQKRTEDFAAEVMAQTKKA